MVVCRKCNCELKYSGGTTNMGTHLRRHHKLTYDDENQHENIPKPIRPTPSNINVRKVSGSGQLRLADCFHRKLGFNSPRSKAISRQLGVFIAHDLRPYSIVKSPSFIKLVNLLEPGYQMPSRPYISETVIPKLYQEVKQDVLDSVMKAESVALTTDGWTSRATESYLTTTAHFISSDWTLHEKVLETIKFIQVQISERLF